MCNMAFLFYAFLLCFVTVCYGNKYEIKGPLTDHFISWLRNEPLKNDYLLRQVEKYGETGSYGGKETDNDTIHHHPIIFVHGNSDSALYISEISSGWNGQIEALLKEHGYTPAEIYAVSFGERNINNAAKQRLTCRDLMGHRRLIEAVLEYTKAEKLNIVAHSMGVTIARRAIKGGKVTIGKVTCHLGGSLASRIHVLLGIAGANYGMCGCMNAKVANACTDSAGFYSGTCGNRTDCNNATAPVCKHVKYGSFLTNLNDGKKEADHVISMWSDTDVVLGKNNIVWGRKTSMIPHSEIYRTFDQYDHFKIKSDAVKEQLSFLLKHHHKRRNHD